VREGGHREGERSSQVRRYANREHGVWRCVFAARQCAGAVTAAADREARATPEHGAHRRSRGRNRILDNENILDGLGHVSARSSANPNHFFSRAIFAPGLVDRRGHPRVRPRRQPVNPKAPTSVRERFIHAAILQGAPRREIRRALAHASVLPFTTSTSPLRPMYHMAPFLFRRAVWNSARCRDMSACSWTTTSPARAGAGTRQQDRVLMRGHGAAIVGSYVPDAVSNASSWT
jgi:HCOMODA/2-hydroxy-3-carboxy-muconic semialdehyde decarboxylase